MEHNTSRPIHVQLTNAIEQAIFSGQMPENTPLPSVRNLATRLGISPNTVVRAYRQLASDGWLRSEPKRGYFVTLGGDEASQIAENAAEDVKQLIDKAILAAKDAHVSTDLFMKWVRERIKTQRAATSRFIAVVGHAEAFLDERVAIVSDAIADLPYDVRGLPIDSLQDGSDGFEVPLEQVACFLVPVGEVRDAAVALGSSANRILPMTRTLRQDVRDAIALQPPWTRFGVVSGSTRGVGRILAALHRLHPLRIPPETVVTEPGAKAEIDRVIDWCDVVVIGTRARPHFAEHGYPAKPTIEMVYIPDDQALRKLRSHLQALQR